MAVSCTKSCFKSVGKGDRTTSFLGGKENETQLKHQIMRTSLHFLCRSFVVSLTSCCSGEQEPVEGPRC